MTQDNLIPQRLTMVNPNTISLTLLPTIFFYLLLNSTLATGPACCSLNKFFEQVCSCLRAFVLAVPSTSSLQISAQISPPQRGQFNLNSTPHYSPVPFYCSVLLHGMYVTIWNIIDLPVYVFLSIPALECQFHKDKDICLFCSLSQPWHLE